MTKQQKIAAWLDARPPIQGERVVDEVDPRHVGTLKARRPGSSVIEWDNGWESHIPNARLKRAKED